MEWKLCCKKQYEVALTRAERGRVYNMPHEAGKVYNFLEDIVEEAEEGAFVCRGTVGEMYVIPRDKLDAYDVDADEIGSEWLTAKTRPQAAVYCCRRVEGPFALATERGVMHGNREGVEHGSGDYVVCRALETEDGYLPDQADCWIVNGVVFDNTYQLI